MRRSASTAAPLIVLVALVVGLAGALGAVTRASRTELRNTTIGDLVVETTGGRAGQVAALPGVTSASAEIDAPVMLDTRVVNGGGVEPERITSGIVVVDAWHGGPARVRSPAVVDRPMFAFVLKGVLAAQTGP